MVVFLLIESVPSVLPSPQVIIVPALSDVHHDNVYPQPPIPLNLTNPV